LGFAYVADMENGLLIFDISDPTQPNEIGNSETQGQAQDIEIHGDHAYVADGNGGMVIFDISETR